MVNSEPMVLFVGLAGSFCLCIFCLLLLLGIVVVDMLLAAQSSYLNSFEILVWGEGLLYRKVRK